MKKIKVELHTHTNYSYDTNLSFEEIIEKCKKENISALAVTDHNEIEGAIRLSKLAPFKVIVGEEIKTKDGEIIGLFLKKFIKPGQSVTKTIEQIRRQEGLVYLPHPFDKTTRKTSVNEQLLVDAGKKTDIIEIHNGRTIFSKDNLKAQKFARKIKRTEAVGSDAHTIFEFGRNYLLMDDYEDKDDFLLKLKVAKLYKKKFIPWVFLLTKFVRFRKKNFKERKFIKIDRTVRCDLCKSSRFRVIYKASGKPKNKYFISDDAYGVHPQIVKCTDCGLIFCHPRIDNKSILKRYVDFVDFDYEKERIARKENQKNILKNIESLINKKGKILDVGAATGAFLETAREENWKPFGIEPSKWAVSFAREKYNLKIKKGILTKASFPKNSFDVISLIDVIEHVESPRNLLALAKTFLKKDGVMVVITPDIKSLLAKALKEKWWHIRPDHIFYFSLKTLKLLSESMGLEIIRVKRPAWNFSYNYWISRFKNKVPSLYKFLHSLSQIPLLNSFTKRNYSINFYDSWEVYLKINEK